MRRFDKDGWFKVKEQKRLRFEVATTRMPDAAILASSNLRACGGICAAGIITTKQLTTVPDRQQALPPISPSLPSEFKFDFEGDPVQSAKSSM